MEQVDPERAAEVHERMFLFEDVGLLSDRDLQIVIREIDQKDWALALRGAPASLKERIMRNMSERGSQMLQEELDYMQPQRQKTIDDAQTKIRDLVRRMDTAGDISLVRGEDEALV
jgi:flagellar motor switch protein FliG